MDNEEMTVEQLVELFGWELNRKSLSRKEAAEMLGLSVDTLDGYDYRDVGPESYSPPGTRRVWYAESDHLAKLEGFRYEE